MQRNTAGRAPRVLETLTPRRRLGPPTVALFAWAVLACGAAPGAGIGLLELGAPSAGMDEETPSPAGRERQRERPRSPISDGLLELSPGRIDLGAVGHLLTRRVAFSVRNGSGEPLALDPPRASCSCLEVELDLSPMPPGETRKGWIRVRLGRGFGNFDKHVDIRPRGTPRATRSIRITAVFHPGVEVEPRQVRLLGARCAKIPSAEGVIVVRARDHEAPPPRPANLRVRKAGSARPSIVRVDRDDATEIRVSLLQDTPAGRGAFTVTFDVNDLPVVVPVSWHQFDRVVVEPAQLVFSRIEGPKDARKTIEIYDPTGLEFELSELQYAPHPKLGGDIDVEVTSAPRRGGGHILTVHALPPYPPQGGRFSGVIRISTSHPKQGHLELRCSGFVAPSGARGRRGD